jgi:hypothetical protein
MDHRTLRRPRVRPGWVVAAALAAVALVAVGIPLASLLYVGVLLLCPLMMLGMHGGHGSHGVEQSHSPDHALPPERDSHPPDQHGTAR